MKDLGATKQILGMKIERKDGTLTLSQEQYVKKLLNRFHMENAKLLSTPLVCHFKLSKNSPTSRQETYHMGRVSYSSTIGKF